MNITVLNYLDHALVDNINTQLASRAEAAKAAKEADKGTGETTDTDNTFSSALNEAVSKTESSTQNTSSSINCPEDLESIFEEAANTYNVSAKLLKAIAKAESNFNPNAVSSAGAVGIMQLMPATAASLGVTNSYDPRQNIMGGAKYIAQLLERYSGNISLALAAYNAGGNNVDKYGGIPPFTETQNYVKKVLSYLGQDITIPSQSGGNSGFRLSENTRKELTNAFSSLFGSQSAGENAMNVIAALFGLIGSGNGASSGQNNPGSSPGGSYDSSSGGEEKAVLRESESSNAFGDRTPKTASEEQRSIDLRVVSDSIRLRDRLTAATPAEESDAV